MLKRAFTFVCTKYTVYISNPPLSKLTTQKATIRAAKLKMRLYELMYILFSVGYWLVKKDNAMSLNLM